MIRDVKISDKKQQLYDAKNSSTLEVGERIGISYNAGSSYVDEKRASQTKTVTILSINGDDIEVEEEKYSPYTIKRSDILHRNLFIVGENPFAKEVGRIDNIAYGLDSIVFSLGITGEKRLYKIKDTDIMSLNWNPFILENGVRKYYQRPFVWTLSENQNLIESIYQGIDCGKILVRNRSWKELRHLEQVGYELAWKDVVDGKQRLNAIRGFIYDEYPDMHGNYFSDLSNEAQHKFGNHQLFSYAEMPEDSSDESVLVQFLKLNFCGVPQSESHLSYVKSLLNG